MPGRSFEVWAAVPVANKVLLSWGTDQVSQRKVQGQVPGDTGRVVQPARFAAPSLDDSSEEAARPSMYRDFQGDLLAHFFSLQPHLNWKKPRSQ